MWDYSASSTQCAPWLGYSFKHISTNNVILDIVDPGITGVVLGDGVTSIGKNAFWECGVLSQVTISASVSFVEASAFSTCVSLRNFDVDEENVVFKSIDGALCSKDGRTLIKVPTGVSGNYVVPNGIELIADYAFQGCTNLTSVTFPGDAPTSVAGTAFSGISVECIYPADNDTWTEAVL